MAPKRAAKRRNAPESSDSPTSERKLRKQSTTATTTTTTTTATKTTAAPSRCYFLVKSEVDVFSIDDMARATETGPNHDEPWDGVRNHQAKNIQKSMRKHDLAFFWGSNTKEPGIFGVVEVTREAFPDESQFDPASKYYDSKSSRENPRWFNVAVRLRKKLDTPVLLKDLKKETQLQHMPLFTQSRLSVQTVPPECWDHICGVMHPDELAEFCR